MSSMDELQQIINDLEKENKKLKEENKDLEEENKIQDIYDGITQNLILSLLSTQNDEMEWNIKNEYTKYCTDENYKEMHEYIQDKIKEMNDTDWNDDGGSLKIEYDDNYTISVVFNDEEDSDDE